MAGTARGAPQPPGSEGLKGSAEISLSCAACEQQEIARSNKDTGAVRRLNSHPWTVRNGRD